SHGATILVLRALLLLRTSRHPVFSKIKVPRLLGAELFFCSKKCFLSGCFARLRKAVYSGLFIVKDVKHRVQLSYRHELRRLIGKVCELKLAACTLNRR